MLNNLISFIVGAIVCFFVYRHFSSSADDNALLNENKLSEQRILALNDSLAKERLVADSLGNKIVSIEAKISSQKDNIVIIQKRYEKERTTVLSLNAVSSVGLLSKNFAADTIN